MSTRIDLRLNEHNSKKVKSTKGYGPWTLIYFEELTSRSKARERELFLKSGSGREYINDLLNSTLPIPIKGPIVQGIPACRQAGNRY